MGILAAALLALITVNSKGPSLPLKADKPRILGVTQSDSLPGFKLDYKLPVNSYLTLHAAATGITSNEEYKEGYRLEMGMRLYFIP